MVCLLKVSSIEIFLVFVLVQIAVDLVPNESKKPKFYSCFTL